MKIPEIETCRGIAFMHVTRLIDYHKVIGGNSGRGVTPDTFSV